MANVKFIAGLVLLSGLLVGIYWLLLGKPAEPLPAPPSSVPVVAAVRLSVSETQGSVTKLDKSGQLSTLQVGASLMVSDEIRTGEQALAVIDSSDGRARIRIGPDAKVAVLSLTNELGRFFLNGGSVEASANGQRLEFAAAGTDGLVRLNDGTARLLSDGQRRLVVGAVSGSAEVEGGGEQIHLHAGEATSLEGKGAPAPMWKIPPSLLLKVDWPVENELNTRRIKVTGQTAPRALVSLRGVRVLADEKGQFKMEVPLDEGDNHLRVVVEALNGTEKSVERRLRVDTTPASVGVETSPEMWRVKAPP